jgi:hypothetical protein
MHKEIQKLFAEVGVETNENEIENFSTIYQKLVEAKGKITDDKQKKSLSKILKSLSKVEGKEQSLFPNEIPKNHFGIPSIFSDTYSNAIDEIDSQKELIANTLQKYTQYNDGSTQIQIDSKGQLGLKFDDEIQNIESDDDIQSIFDVIKKTGIVNPK